MNAIRRSSLTAAVLGCSLVVASFGCVSSSTYELARSNAENAKLLYQSEQRRANELAASAKKMKQHIEELEASLQESRDKLTRTDRDWRETRDELLRLKIEREQARRKGGERAPEFVVHAETEKPAPALEPEPPQPKAGPQSDDPKRRLKELLQQLQSALEHL